MYRSSYTFACALLVTTAAISSGGDMTLEWRTVDGGGATMTGSTYTLEGTVGQPDAGAMFGATFVLDGGFWPGAASSAPPCPQDLDGNGDVGFADLVQVLANWGLCGLACSEDLDGSGDVGFGDVVSVLANWGPCA